MERIAYARLYATVAGTLLVLLGLAGLMVNAEFRSPELTDKLLGFYTVNGWANSFHVLAGLLGLFLARPLPRLYALLAGIAFTGLAIWGFLAADGTQLFDALPALRAVNVLNLLIGLFGLTAFAASRWDRIRTWFGGLGARFGARSEKRRQKRRRRQVRRRRAKAAR